VEIKTCRRGVGTTHRRRRRGTRSGLRNNNMTAGRTEHAGSGCGGGGRVSAASCVGALFRGGRPRFRIV